LESDITNGYENNLPNVTNLMQNHDYGTNYLKKAIKKAARHFLDHWWSNLSQQEKTQRNNTALIRTVHASTQGGGDTAKHAGHEAGLDVDIRVLNLDGTAGGCWNDPCLNDSTANSPRATYDRDAARAICEGFSSLDEVDRIFFNDPTINANAQSLNPPGNAVDKVRHLEYHHDHIHVDVNCPQTPFPGP
jgi:murein endopeptidase